MLLHFLIDFLYVIMFKFSMYQFFRQEFSEYAVASFAVRVETWVERSTIVFVRSATEVLLACVTVARFASNRVWS